MASIIKSNTYADFNGREILTANNDGALTTQKILYPAFNAYLSSTTNLSDNVWTKIQLDTEFLDTDGTYDNSTNYRFTPAVAGKYYISFSFIGASNVENGTRYVQSRLYKNGSVVTGTFGYQDVRTNYGVAHQSISQAILDLNTTDYIEFYGRVDIQSGQARAHSESTALAYRIGS